MGWPGLLQESSELGLENRLPLASPVLLQPITSTVLPTQRPLAGWELFSKCLSHGVQVPWVTPKHVYTQNLGKQGADGTAISVHPLSVTWLIQTLTSRGGQTQRQQHRVT